MSKRQAQTPAVVRWVWEQLCQDDMDVTGHYGAEEYDRLTEVRYWEAGAPGEDEDEDGPEDPRCILAVEITHRGRWSVSASDARTFTATDYRRRFASPREAVAHFYPEAEVR